jgi:hypothetical protein
MIENFNDWKCRASAMGNIVTKSGKVTDGMITFLGEVFIGEVYGVRKEAYGKQLDKGIACEEDGFAMLNLLYPDNFIQKIKEHTEGEYEKGTGDTIIENTVWDIKNAFTLFTFGKAEMNWLYEWQLKTYMKLYNLQRAGLFYCLNDMPEYMIAEEQRKLFYTARKWVSMEDPDYTKACEELEAANKYGHMPIEDRFKVWFLDRKEEDDNRIENAVKQSREILNEMLLEHNKRIESNKLLIKIAA